MTEIDRRGTLALMGGGALAASLSAAPMPQALAIHSVSGRRDYRAAIEAIRAYALAELATTGLPGMTMALADADGFAATLSLGWADVAARRPVAPDQLFEIGSISKSVVGLWLHAAAARGKVDLAAPVARYLPDVPVPATPITLAQLLNHCGGTAEDAPAFPRSPDGRLWSGFRPGSKFSYSNIGYLLLGLVVDRVAGRPHAQVLAAEVLAPLGMAGAVAHIRTADRPRFATGYAPLRDDRPPLTGAEMAEGPWGELDMASGSVGASATAMIGYLRYVLALGQGRGGVLMPDAAARAMLAVNIAAEEFGKGARYASGFATQRVGDRAMLHHTGGMLTFSSSFHADAPGGVAAFASVNGRLGDYRPRRATSYACEVLRAVRDGRAIPPMPDAMAFRRVEKPERFVGRWLGPADEALEVRQGPAGLTLAADDATGRLEPFGARTLGTDHPTRGGHALEFEGEKDAVSRLWWGGTLYARGTAPAQPPVPAALRAYEGSYVGRDPWAGTAEVIARGDRLAIDGAGEIARRPGGFWSAVADEGGVDRFWFDAPVMGRPSRLIVNGNDLIRVA